ncbi:6-hydroxynicotinate 3-monooxygenase isoform X1 [Macadamia integrifolia]|uniref:6-hydroxynicotinate 3-monooxygenase isoform X1 n=1 Tax=Macadamia integrifolia TaxID=60698 RepID=UPI001C4F8B76|nr:6-hydroxynicotinate 3-monooxygenase isoform X1 [Macadamia integrifolia]
MEGAGVDRKKTRKPKAVVVGGSIAGLSCAHALIAAGWDVVVLEKSTGPPSSSLTGAGLGLDPLARRFIQSWLDQPQLFHDSTLPLSVDQNKATDSEKKISWTLTRDDNFNFRAAHWVHLHGLLYRALPSHIVLWGHYFLSFSNSDDKSFVKVTAKVLHTEDTIEIVADLLIAADGSRSKIRQTFLPSIKLRYSGYYAWRGVHDFTEDENSDTIVGIRKAYPELGHCLYFDMAKGTHCVLYELPNKRMNWLWYVNQPEPELKGNSVTIKVSSEMIKQLHEEAEKTWVPELARVMKETKEPFINVIYDSDPLEQLFWDNVVMVGDAAHPTTPHGLRSTNMSILDAAILGKCLEKWGVDNLGLALKEFQSIQLPIVSKQVLHARRIGRIKQGLTLPDRKNFDPTTATTEDCQELQQKNMPFFADIPSLLGST